MKPPVHEMFRDTPQGERYKLLWRMIKRFYYVFKSINEGVSPFPLEYYDIISSYFIYSYHLKDWLKADLNISEKDICELFSSNPELRYCADLCDGFKHLKRNRLHSKSQPDYERITIRIEKIEKDGKRISGVFFEISTDQGKMDAFILSSKCLDIWYEFIRKYDPTISKEREDEAGPKVDPAWLQ